MGAIITLTTDFGLSDGYVAAMKGVILSINPEAKLIDICHTIRPQDIAQAAFVLSTAYPFFPKGTIHLVVVDPGVGTERRAIILRTPSADFVAPDNGVLSYVIAPPAEGGDHSRQRELGPGMEAVAITKPQFWRSPVSPTFHGRDIFAPVAARLSLGLAPEQFGERISSLTVLPIPRPHKQANGSLVGRILHIDAFGNLITNIRAEDLPQAKDTLTIKLRGRLIRGISRTYAQGEELLALIGSSGYLEVSLREGSARELLRAEVGDEVTIINPKGGW